MDGVMYPTEPAAPTSLDDPTDDQQSSAAAVASLELETVVKLINEARDSQGHPGGKANLMAAEVAAGRFVADYHQLLGQALQSS